MGFPSQTTLLPSPFILDNTHVRNEHFHLTVVDEKLEVDYRVADERHSDGNSHGENLEALSAPTRFDAIARIKCCVENQFSQEANQEDIHTKATHGEEIQPEESDGERTRPPLKDFVGLREQMHVEDGGKPITSKHRRSCMPDSYRPSLAELLEESMLTALARNEQQHHAIADDSKNTTDDAPNLNEPSTLNDSLLASLSSINNNIFRPRRNSPPITLPSSAYDPSSASGTDSGTDSQLEVDSDDYYDPDPQDVLGPCIASPVIPSSPKFSSCTTATKMANARGGKATARTPYPLLSSGAALLRPPPHPRVFAVKNDIEYGRRKACGVRLWRGNKSSLGMEVAV